MTDEQWSTVLDVTLNGTFRCTAGRAAAHDDRAGSGVIVNNASVLGWRAQAGQAHYAAAKAGVMALTRCAAIEAAPAGVRVNAVAPSLAMHPFLAKVTTDELLAELTEREAFGRAAEPWEVANVIVFLASDYSSYMTGEVVSVSAPAPLMAPTVLDGLDAVRAAAGTHLGWSDWIEIDQERVDRFAAATGGPATADGWLTLALTNLFMPQIVEVRGVSLGVNYGTDAVRFPAGAGRLPLRGGGELVEVTDAGPGVQTRIRITVEVEGQTEPACVVDALSRWMP